MEFNKSPSLVDPAVKKGLADLYNVKQRSQPLSHQIFGSCSQYCYNAIINNKILIIFLILLGLFLYYRYEMKKLSDKEGFCAAKSRPSMNPSVNPQKQPNNVVAIGDGCVVKDNYPPYQPVMRTPVYYNPMMYGREQRTGTYKPCDNGVIYASFYNNGTQFTTMPNEIGLPVDFAETDCRFSNAVVDQNRKVVNAWYEQHKNERDDLVNSLKQVGPKYLKSDMVIVPPYLD